MAKQLEGKSSRNRNRNSSMRKSVGSSSPKKREQTRKTSEKEMSPKKEIKKGKSPTKEVKIEKNPPTKSGKENNPPNIGNLMGKEKLFEYFTNNGIKYSNVEHPEVFTVEAMIPYLKNVKGAVCKNFLSISLITG